MKRFPFFLSVVFVVRNQARQLAALLAEAGQQLGPLVTDYELIVVDNASTDDSLEVCKALTFPTGLPNVQVYALTKEVDADTASWVGLENALGDFVAVIDPLADDLAFVPEMLKEASSGVDIVLAQNQILLKQSLPYRLAHACFNRVYQILCGVDLATESPQFRVLSKRVVNFILQHPQPALTYRHLPATGGFSRANLSFCFTPRAPRPTRIGESIDRGMRLLVSTTRAPMRLVTSLSLFGAIANVVYSLYVIGVYAFQADVAPGWASLSLQQSGMFFLLSLVLLVLGEYILQLASLSNEGPAYHVSQEFTSARMTRREKLNVEEAQPVAHVLPLPSKRVAG